LNKLINLFKRNMEKPTIMNDNNNNEDDDTKALPSTSLLESSVAHCEENILTSQNRQETALSVHLRRVSPKKSVVEIPVPDGVKVTVKDGKVVFEREEKEDKRQEEKINEAPEQELERKSRDTVKATTVEAQRSTSPTKESIEWIHKVGTMNSKSSTCKNVTKESGKKASPARKCVSSSEAVESLRKIGIRPPASGVSVSKAAVKKLASAYVDKNGPSSLVDTPERLFLEARTSGASLSLAQRFERLALNAQHEGKKYLAVKLLRGAINHHPDPANYIEDLRSRTFPAPPSTGRSRI